MQSCGRYRRMSGTAGAARPMNRARHETPADWAACRIQSAGFSSRQFSATGRGVPGERRGPQPLTGPFPPPGGRKERRGIPSERAMPGSRRRHRSSGEKRGGAFSRRRVPSQNRVDGVARGVWLCSDMGADLRCRRAVRVPHGRKASCIHGRPACAFARLRLPKPPLTRQRARAASMTGRMLSTQRSPARMASSAL